jgi:hypothetical protein
MLLRFRQSVSRATLKRSRRSIRGADVHRETLMEPTMPPNPARLKGKKIAILATDGFEQSELPSLQTDVRNAGGRWSDQEVVVDRGLVTSRKPDDIPAFNRKMIEEIADGAASSQTDRSTVES